MVTTMTGDRGAELLLNLGRLRARIYEAAIAAGRRGDEITLVVVTKFFPASDLRELAGLGIHDVGENRLQEAEEKAASCRDLGLRLHHIGAIQSNKAAAVARYADMVQSVDRAKVIPGLARGASERGRPLDVLVQVSLDSPGTVGRAGILPEDARSLADGIAQQPTLNLRGVMAVAPLGMEPVRAFEHLADIAAEIRSDHPSASVISAGMSGDLEEAIKCGATHLRIGSAVLGNRPLIK